ncbi:MAG: FtsH protease activity modulator HflK [Pseudomonadales bacterium]|nr:FtsH protease activity modulator HflK [Pseudomonadales bacterium]
MAWNEPGGGRNNNQDPWRGNNDNQGPPDLDEVLKKLQDRLGSLFGGGKGGSGGSSSGGKKGANSIALVVVVAVIAAGVWGFSGFYKVEEAEEAVVLHFGEFSEIKGAGLRWNPPVIDRILKVNTKQVSSHAHQATMLSKDDNIVDVQLVVQYRVHDPKSFFLNIGDPLGALRQATESALRHEVGNTDLDTILTEGRHVMAQEVKGRLQTYLDVYTSGLYVDKVNIQDAHPPKAVKAAFDDVIKAKEDKTRLKNEAEAYSNGIIPEARGYAKRQESESNAYRQEMIARANGETIRFTRLLAEYQKAPVVTRQRLYLETMEKVLGSSTKVLVDLEGGNNILYLPLDKIISQQRTIGNIPLNQSLSGTGLDESASARSRTHRDGIRGGGR